MDSRTARPARRVLVERLRSRPRRIAAAFSVLAVVATAIAIAAGSGATSAARGANTPPPSTPDYATAVAGLKKWGWTPAPGSIPQLACSDNSYTNAVQNGLTYGTYSLKPYFYQGANGKPAGYEYDLLRATLDYAGIKNLKITYAPFDSLIPALTANRIDMMPAHETPERLKVIGFTAPVYWYGPGIVVKSSNPAHLRGYADLKKKGVTVGVVTGSAAQLYMQRVGGKVLTYKDQTSEFASLTAGRESAVLEDAPTIAQYLKIYKKSGLKVLKTAPLSPATLGALGYSDFEWGIRKSSCSLDLALSRSLAVLRAHGVVKAILDRAGMAGLAGTDIPGMAG